MTVLDHSSPEALLADLDRHPAGVFRFDYRGETVGASPWWCLRSAAPENGGVRLRIEYCDSGSGEDLFLRLGGGRLVYASPSMTVVAAYGPDGSVPDDFFRHQRDENLRRVFA